MIASPPMILPVFSTMQRAARGISSASPRVP
jgi:hypothetical protein